MSSRAYHPAFDFNRALRCTSAADAFGLLLRAAEGGCLRAQTRIGLAYHTGCGVGIDYERAAAWYRRAACGADDCAMANLGVMALLGQPGPADEQEAYCWIRSAVAMGHARLRPALDWLERRIVRGVGEESLRPSISLEIPASRPCTQSACVHSLCNVA